MSLEQIKTGILGLSNSEIEEVINNIKFRRNEIGRQVKNQFKVGDKVWFNKSQDGQRVNGTVSKINRKNIQVRENDRNWVVWNVSPNLLTKESE